MTNMGPSPQQQPLPLPQPPQVAMMNVRLSSGQEFGPATLDLVEQWAREGRVPTDALLAPTDGSPPRPASMEDRLRPFLRAPLSPSPGSVPLAALPVAPPTAPGPVTRTDDGGGVMIPYKNPPALVGYYIAVASLIPLLGVVTGPIAVVLGIVGLRKRLKNPEAHGIAHAWIAIILGATCTLGYGGCLVMGILNAMAN